jgi:hypothetical protein
VITKLTAAYATLGVAAHQLLQADAGVLFLDIRRTGPTTPTCILCVAY